jgi:hypothetical protein
MKEKVNLFLLAHPEKIESQYILTSSVNQPQANTPQPSEPSPDDLLAMTNAQGSTHNVHPQQPSLVSMFTHPQRPLDASLQALLLGLQQSGLTVNHLRNWQQRGFNGCAVEHLQALAHLISDLHVDPAAAILEINQLDSEQASVLKELYADGLKGDHLRRWRRRDNFIYPEEQQTHQQTLVYLIRHLHVDPALAMQEINQLSGIQISALKELYANGLRGDHLRSFQGEAFWNEHQQALAHLIRDFHVDPAVAVQEINQLNTHQVSALKELYANGLRGDHLRSWKPKQISFGLFSRPSEFFRIAHHLALTHLMKDLHMDPAAAIREINKLDSDQAMRVFEGETREQVLTGSSPRPDR